MTTGGAKLDQATGPLEGKDRLDSWEEIAAVHAGIVSKSQKLPGLRPIL
jgi:hypothetical protein